MPQVMKDRAAMIDEELHDLKLRFELLEGDRKAYYETSQWAIRQNKEHISQLRVQNKELRELMSRLKKQEADVNNNSHYRSEVDKIEHRLCEYHKKYDDLQAIMRQKENKIAKMRDQLNDLKKEMASGNQMQNSPYAKEIRMLENRLDKAMIKYSEAQSVRRTYEQIVKKLQEERLTFDNQLHQFERALKAKKQEVAELEVMSRDANHARDVAKAELGRFEQQIGEERKVREKELNEKREHVRETRESNEQGEQTQKLLLDATDTNVQRDTQNSKEADEELHEKRVSDYEEAIRTIKEATGVSNINEVLQKFKSQGDTRTHLLMLQKQYEGKIEELKKKKKEVRAEYDEEKYLGESKHSNTRRMVEEFTEHLKTSNDKCNEAKNKYERVAKVLINAKTGVQHLWEKLEIVQLQGQPQKLSMSDSTLVQMFDSCVAKLNELNDNIKDKEIPADEREDKLLQFTQSALPVHNTRVKMKPVEFEKMVESEGDEDDDEAEEVPDREMLKKFTTQLLNARQKAKQPKNKRKKKLLQEDD